MEISKRRDDFSLIAKKFKGIVDAPVFLDDTNNVLTVRVKIMKEEDVNNNLQNFDFSKCYILDYIVDTSNVTRLRYAGIENRRK